MRKIETNNAPAAIGPYSQGIVTGNLLFVSGQLPIDPKTGEFAGDDIVSQTRQSLENIKAIIVEAGSSMDKVVKTTVFLTDINDFGKMNEIYGEYFTGVCPARCAYQVSALPKGAKVEIEAVVEL